MERNSKLDNSVTGHGEEAEVLNPEGSRGGAREAAISLMVTLVSPPSPQAWSSYLSEGGSGYTIS